MVIIKRKDMELSIGKAVGHILEDELVKTKKRLWIISPWLSRKYAQFLRKKSEEGTNVKLITTNDYTNKEHREALKTLIQKKAKPAFPSLTSIGGRIILIVLLFIGIIFFSFHPWVGWVLIVGSLLLLVVSLMAKPLYESTIPLTIIDKYADFTHSKIYILDNKAIVGSANLTESGLWKNLESLVIVKRKDVIKTLIDIFESLEKHPIKEIIPIEEVGKTIYSK